jgi:hypothetical protein
MNINAAIIDQRLNAVAEEIEEKSSLELNISGERLKSVAFVFLCVKTILDIESDEAFDCLTEGGQDFGIDAIHISEERDGEFTVSLFQGKYSRNIKGNSEFPENGIKSIIYAIKCLFDPNLPVSNINTRLLTKLEEIRSIIRDGFIPQVRALACNNGRRWNSSADEEINRAKFGDQVTWEHVNHDTLVTIFQAAKPVNDTLKFTGECIVEDFNFSRVMIGRIAVAEIAALIQRHGERLLERNIRRYLGLQGNRVNQAIRNTLTSQDPSNFYFYNNGITLTCDKFSYNALQKGDYQVKIENLQIINGGQTCMTIYKTLTDDTMLQTSVNAFVLARLYQLPSDNEDIVRNITLATNSQNPVDLRDLKSNDEIQRRLEIDIEQLGYLYRRKRLDAPTKPTEITSSVAAEAILSVWRKRPQQAKFFAREHFGKLYPDIFTQSLNGAQTIIASLIYRIAENRRKRPPQNSPQFLPYASCFLAMQMGKYLLKDMGCDVDGITHQNFVKAKQLIEANEDAYVTRAITDIEKALSALYGNSSVSLQQLAATFRRGDLIEKIDQLELEQRTQQ